MDKKIIELQHVSKTFKGSEVASVKDVSLSVKEGEFVTIVGTSGSGKTTLLKMINRIYETSEGKILFYGAHVDEIKGEEYRRKIGYVIQQGGLFPHWTVAENVATVPKILKWPKDKIEARVDELLKMVKLNPEIYRDRYPSKLSGGEAQRVGIARALAAEPSLMLMDEPFGAIDAITRKSMQEELIKLQKQTGVTVLFVTHDINEALKLGDKVIVMHGGEVQQYDTPYNIIMNPANEFVSKLINMSGSFYDRLSFIQAKDVMKDISGNHEESSKEKSFYTIQTSSMNEVFKDFLDTGKECCYVQNVQGDTCGYILYTELLNMIHYLNKEEIADGRDD